MPLVGFEPAISAGELPQTYPLDRVATGTGTQVLHYYSEKDTSNPQMQQRYNERQHIILWL